MEDKTKNLLYVIGGFILYVDPFTKKQKDTRDGEISAVLTTGMKTAGLFSAFEGLKGLGLDTGKAAGVAIAGAMALEWSRQSRAGRHGVHGVKGEIAGWEPWEHRDWERRRFEHREEPWRQDWHQGQDWRQEQFRR